MTNFEQVEITFGSFGDVKPQLGESIELPNNIAVKKVSNTKSSTETHENKNLNQTSSTGQPGKNINGERKKSKKKQHNQSQKPTTSSQQQQTKEKKKRTKQKSKVTTQETKNLQQTIKEPTTIDTTKEQQINEKQTQQTLGQELSWSQLFSKRPEQNSIQQSNQSVEKSTKEKKQKKKKLQQEEKTIEQPKEQQKEEPKETSTENKESTKEPTIKQEQPKEEKQKKKKKKSTQENKQKQSENENLLKSSIIEFDNNQKVFIQPRGLNNVQNSCYMNAAMQSLLYIPSFYNMYKKIGQMKLDKDTYPLTKQIVRFINEFKPVSPEKERIESGTPFTPDYLLEYMSQNKNNALIQGNQHDAHEFLTFLLERLHEELLKTADRLKQNKDEELNEDTDEGGWEEVGKRGKASLVQEIKHIESSISSIFCGKMRSLLKQSGSKPSLTLQPFYTLHLPVNENVHNIKDAFQIITTEERLETNASKQITLEYLPPVLILHLKRFTFDKNGSKKVLKKVQFFSQLYIDPYIINTSKLPEKDPKRNYELYSVICHHGKQSSSGHYSTYTRHPCGKWVHIDDTKVTFVSQNHVMKQQAYILIYVQQSERKQNNGRQSGGKKKKGRKKPQQNTKKQ